jgi:CHASE2 domain-containing sensor protein
VGLNGKLGEAARAALVGAGSTVFLGVLLLVSPLGQALTNASYDLPYYFRADITDILTNDVLLVVMDDESHRHFGPYWSPWDRTYHAWLIDRLRTCGAKAIAFDILFDAENPTNRAADARLVEAAAAAHGQVAAAAMLLWQTDPQGRLIARKMTPPFYALRSHVAWGIAEEAGEDVSIRQHSHEHGDIPSLALRVAQMTMTNAPAPTEPRWVNYYGPPGLIPRKSFWEVLLETNRLGRAELSNKVVFVGAQFDVGYSGGRGTDDFRTPYTRWKGRKAPGVEVNATTYLNLVRGDWLHRTSPFAEFLLVVGAGLVLGGGLGRCRPMSALAWGVLAFVVLTVVAHVLVWKFRLWFPWLIIGGVQIPVALGWAVLAHTKRLHQVNEALERELAMTGYAPGSASSGPHGLGPQSARRYVPELPQAIRVTVQDGESPAIPDHALVRRVGQGAYGEVWLARNVIGTYHAVKIVDRKSFRNEAAPFEREFRGIQKFTPISRSHPGFVNILHVGRNDAAGYFYYIMEVGDDEVTGPVINPDSYSPKNLAKALKTHGRLPPPECLRLALDLSAALDHLHQHHLVHRDVKPSNIIFVGGQPKLADIGLVTDIGSTGVDVSYVGTQGYIPPEGPGTPAGDVYSFGKLIYQASTGLDCARFPELPTALVELTNEPWLFQINKIFIKACEPDPRRRYQTAAAVHADVLALKAHLQTG